MPVEGDPTDGIQGPEDAQIERVPGTDVAGTTTAGAIAGEGIAEVLFVRHQLGTPGIQSTLHQDQSRGVQTKRNGVVNKEITRTDLQEEVVATIDGVDPTGQINRTGIASCGCGIG